MKSNYRGFIGAGILGCILVLLATPVFAQGATTTDNRCTGDNEQRCGAVKLCKVAGLGVPLGTSFTFNWSDPTAQPPVTIPAGPAPGGNCVMGKLPIGTIVTIQENPTSGVAVSNIEVAPASSIVPPGPNITTGAVKITVVSGVTEVTYTDHSQKAGYLEICKQGVAGAAPMTGNFIFTIPSGVPGSVTVQPKFCSPPIEVWAGSVIITETPPTSGIHISSCTVFPPSHGPCVVTGLFTVKVPIVPGGLSTQTVVTVTNERK
jgi:hypothetical protein